LPAQTSSHALHAYLDGLQLTEPKLFGDVVDFDDRHDDLFRL
jgi:hypothetical protein